MGRTWQVACGAACRCHGNDSASSPSATGGRRGLADADGGRGARQTVELAVAAEEVGIDGAFVRVHHFARQLVVAVPAAGGDRRAHGRIEIGTGVIDMRYENPLYMAEEAAAADLLSGGRLQLGISRGSPEPAWHGSEAFGYVPPEGRRTPTRPRQDRAASGPRSRAPASCPPTRAAAGPSATAGDPAAVTGPARAHLVGLRHAARPRVWAGEQGMNLMSSTLLLEDTGVPFDQLQAEQIAMFREAWAERGLGARAARLGQPQRHPDHVSDLDRRCSGASANAGPGRLARRGARPLRQAYTGEPDEIAAELAEDAAVRGRRHRAADGAEPARRRLQRADARDDRRATSRRRSAGCRRLAAERVTVRAS